MLRIYEIEDGYIEYLHSIDKRVFLPKKDDARFTRKYIGIVLKLNEYNYLVPLSSYKEDMHGKMYESISFKKIAKYAVLRINNMFPVPDEFLEEVVFKNIEDIDYKNLLLSEYRIIKKREAEIRRDSKIIYNFQTNIANVDKKLYLLCCDFKLLEDSCLKQFS